MFGFKKIAMPSAKDALPGREQPIRTASEHFVNHHPLKGPYPEGSEKVTVWPRLLLGRREKVLGIGRWHLRDRGRLRGRHHA